MASEEQPEPTVVGWREWVVLPGLRGAEVKAKVDTGARTSSLHAFDVAEIERDGQRLVRFSFHPIQRNEQEVVTAEATLLDRRRVTASSGHSEERYVVETELRLDGGTYPIELTLSRRDAMGFRMLLGRHALKGRHTVDPARSYRSAESKEHRRRARRARRRKEKPSR